MKVALITPLNGDWAYDSYMMLDGLIQLQKEQSDLEFYISSDAYRKHPFPTAPYVLPREAFIAFARRADLIMLFWCKKDTDLALTEEIGAWHKTIYVDGSELGMNRRHDPLVQLQVLRGTYRGEWGGIDEDMLRRCLRYYRREKPYTRGIIPLPYSITSVFTKYYREGMTKDIDFFCVWGQDEYPISRRYAQELLVDFCRENGFTYWIGQTATRDEYYAKLSRSKVGISIGGGGYDTARFWEILGNNCLLLTERIDIDRRDLDYRRIYEFNNLYDFQQQLEKVGKFLREEYAKIDLMPEYRDILSRHSSKARTLTVLREAQRQ